MKNNEIMSRIINFDKKTIKEEETGKITTMYSVNYEVETAPYSNHYGPTVLNSYASESAFEILKSNLGKTVKIELEEKTVFGRANTYKKVVSKINGKSVRQF